MGVVTHGEEVDVKLGVVILHRDPATIFNALRLANFALGKGDQVEVFLIGKGVEFVRGADRVVSF